MKPTENRAKQFGGIISTARFPDWWSFKLPPLLAIGYATGLIVDVPVYQITPYLIFLLAAIVVGAVYVSLINDITDIEEDLAAGKRNRMVNIPVRIRWLLPLGSMALGAVFGCYLWPDALSIGLYIAPWVSFSLYSIPPFRFKSRGILGVLCDACGAHVFPSLLMVSSITYISGRSLNVYWFAAVGIWALCYGLRGILLHQFEDKDADLTSKVNTFASNISSLKAKILERWIFVFELTAFALMFILTYHWIAAFFLGCYMILIWFRLRVNKQYPVIFLTKPGTRHQILMADYYQLFFPLSLLLQDAFDHPWTWLVLVAQLLLFPKLWLDAIRDTYQIRHLIA